MSVARLVGSCLCGAVRFEARGAFEAFYLCHCAHCRKDTGSAHAANLFSSHGTLAWTSGADRVRTFQLAGTRHARAFCATCGSALPRVDDGFVAVPAGSLDTPVPLAPQAHLFRASRADWDEALERLPWFEGLPTSEGG